MASLDVLRLAFKIVDQLLDVAVLVRYAATEPGLPYATLGAISLFLSFCWAAYYNALRPVDDDGSAGSKASRVGRALISLVGLGPFPMFFDILAGTPASKTRLANMLIMQNLFESIPQFVLQSYALLTLYGPDSRISVEIASIAVSGIGAVLGMSEVFWRHSARFHFPRLRHKDHSVKLHYFVFLLVPFFAFQFVWRMGVVLEFAIAFQWWVFAYFGGAFLLRFALQMIPATQSGFLDLVAPTFWTEPAIRTMSAVVVALTQTFGFGFAFQFRNAFPLALAISAVEGSILIAIRRALGDPSAASTVAHAVLDADAVWIPVLAASFVLSLFFLFAFHSRMFYEFDQKKRLNQLEEIQPRKNHLPGTRDAPPEARAGAPPRGPLRAASSQQKPADSIDEDIERPAAAAASPAAARRTWISPARRQGEPRSVLVAVDVLFRPGNPRPKPRTTSMSKSQSRQTRVQTDYSLDDEDGIVTMPIGASRPSQPATVAASPPVHGAARKSRVKRNRVATDYTLDDDDDVDYEHMPTPRKKDAPRRDTDDATPSHNDLEYDISDRNETRKWQEQRARQLAETAEERAPRRVIAADSVVA